MEQASLLFLQNDLTQKLAKWVDTHAESELCILGFHLCSNLAAHMAEAACAVLKCAVDISHSQEEDS